MDALYWIIRSDAGFFRNGLYGWVANEECATRYDTHQQAQAYVNLHAPAQQKELMVIGVYPGDELNELWYQ